jgi:hypothetical protein
MEQNLKFRHEMKFFVNAHQNYIIRQRLRELMEPDEHAGPGGEYHIRSLYFDDMCNKALSEKLGGVQNRVKYRIRIYNRSDRVIHFEKKIKKNDYIAKVKAPLTREETDSILAGNYEVLHRPDNPFLMELYREMKIKLLRPKVIVDYVREPYVCKYGNVRITFDKELRTGLHETDLFQTGLNPIRALDDGMMILEVKYDDYLPAAIQAGLQLEVMIRQSASKYVICRKYLKSNTWEDY